MDRRFVAVGFAFAVLLSVTACSSGDTDDARAASQSAAADGGVTVPSSSRDLEGQMYQEVADQLTSAGFTSIETKALGDLKTGWLKDPGEIKEVSIDGQTSFGEGDSFPTGAAIVISYHSFPEDDEDKQSSEPLVVDDSEDLAALVAGPPTGATLEAFVDEHHLEAIQLDACVTWVIASDRVVYSTANVVWGDCGKAPVTGPTFNFTPLLLPATSPLQQSGLAVGQNVRLTGQVGSLYAFEESATYIPARDDRVVLLVDSIELR